MFRTLYSRPVPQTSCDSSLPAFYISHTWLIECFSIQDGVFARGSIHSFHAALVISFAEVHSQSSFRTFLGTPLSFRWASFPCSCSLGEDAHSYSTRATPPDRPAAPLPNRRACA